jgi:hypothetical protein
MWQFPLNTIAPCSWTPEESEVESCKHQDNANIHCQPFPESVSEKREIYTDYDGYHRHHVKHDSYVSAHFNYNYCGCLAGQQAGRGRKMPIYERGDYIKVEFADDATGMGEWMWVRVSACDDAKRLVFGILDNEPVNDDKLQLGSELAISFDQIREHRKATDFDMRH